MGHFLAAGAVLPFIAILGESGPLVILDIFLSISQILQPLLHNFKIGGIQIEVPGKFTGEKKNLLRLFRTGQFPASWILPLGS